MFFNVKLMKLILFLQMWRVGDHLTPESCKFNELILFQLTEDGSLSALCAKYRVILSIYIYLSNLHQSKTLIFLSDTHPLDGTVTL